MTEATGAERRGVVYGLAAYGLWGLFPLYFPLLDPASAFEVLCHRVVWSFAVLALVLTLTRRWAAATAVRAAPLALATLAGVLIATNWGVYIWAVGHDHVVEAALGYFVGPLVSVALGVMVLGERLRPAPRLALVVAAGAVGVLTVAYGRVPVIALVLATSFAAYGLVKKLVALDPLSSLAVETAVLTPLAAVGLVVIGLRGDLVFATHGLGRSALLVSAGVVTVTPLVLFGAAARRVPLSTLGLLQYVTPTGQFLCGVLVFHEAVSAARWAGFVLVWVALAVLTVDGVAQARRATKPTAVAARAARDPGNGEDVAATVRPRARERGAVTRARIGR